MGRFKNVVQKWGKIGLIGIFLVLVFLAGNTTGHAPTVQVLSAHTHTLPSPTPTVTPLPTSVPVTVINNIILPTTAPTSAVPTAVPTAIPTSTLTPSPVVPTPTPPTPTTPTIQSTEEVTPTPTPTVIPTATPTPGTIQSPASPAAQTATILVEYAGEHAESTYTVSLTAGETAWQVVQSAVGLSNLHDTDYGGSLGIFITGFNGIDAGASQYYDFQVNGTSSNVGVSSYIVTNHDVLKFVLTGF